MLTVMCDYRRLVSSRLRPSLVSWPVLAHSFKLFFVLALIRSRSRSCLFTFALVGAVGARCRWHPFAFGCASLPLFELALVLVMGLDACYTYR
jgi:hypothetical protein